MSDLSNIRPATDADAPRILALLALVAHSPNETPTSVKEMIASDMVHVDDVADIAIRFVIEAEKKHVEIPWMLWRGGDIADLVRVLLKATDAVLSAHPAASWTISGTFDGAGDTALARRRASRQVAEGMKVWLPDVAIAPDPNSSYYRASSTVGRVNEAAREFLVSPHG